MFKNFGFKILSVLIITPISPVKSEDFVYPVLRGDYLVCPNGFATPLRYWGDIYLHSGFNPKDLRFSGGNWYPKVNVASSQISMGSQVTLGNRLSSYTQKSLNLTKQALLKPATLPNPYLVTRISLSPNPTYEHRNSIGKNLTIKKDDYGFWKVIDNSGNIVSTRNSPSKTGMIFCDKSGFVQRVVEQLDLIIDNRYGETIDSPVLFWRTEVYMKPVRVENKANLDL